MRTLAVGLWILVACGDDGGGGPIDGATPVAELSSTEQQSLCERFLDVFCTHPDAASFCEDPCIASGCGTAVDGGHVATECMATPTGGVITGAMVDECAETGTFGVCAEGGGCMIDALEAACP